MRKMGSLSGLTLAFSSFCGLILLGIVVGVCYLVWWKKNYANGSRVVDEDYSFLQFWKKPAPNPSIMSEEQIPEEEATDLEKGESNKILEIDENVEMELRRMHHLLGPPRFLFPIKEESKEDLESDLGTVKSRGKSLSEGCFYNLDNDDDASPLSSFRESFDSYSNMGENPLFESLSVDEINRLRSSPPPKLECLRDAEDRFIKKMLIMEYEKKFRTENQNPGHQISKHEIIIHGSQVFPLPSSPT